MKKIALIIMSAIILIATAGFVSTKNYTEMPVSKSINVEVYKEVSYTSPAYDDTYATLNITVIKVSGNKRDTAFTHNFTPMQLKIFPTSDKPLIRKISVGNINDSKERLEIYYRLTYNTKGSELSFSDGTLIGKGCETHTLNIKI